MLISRQKQTMQDMKERFSSMPTSSHVVVIDGISYTIVRHYTGSKYVDLVIREIAEKESCVIVGRCADYVLRDMDNVVKIYLYAPIRDCMRRVIRLYELNPEDAKSLIHSMNKTRGDYYQHNTGLNWSEAVHYDICLNTAGLKKEKIIDIIKNYIKTKID